MSDPGAQNEAPAAATAAKPASRLLENAVLDERFQIDFKQPLPRLDSGTAKAYIAIDRKTPARQSFALLCAPEIPHRGAALRALIDRPCPHVLSVYGAGSVEVFEGGERRFVVILERPAGRRLWENGKPEGPVGEKLLFETIMPQVATAIEALAQRNVAHRAIRPDNIFWLDEAGTQIALGDCVTSLPGRFQPGAYETIGRSMASVFDRGEGAKADDYYALGVASFALAAGREPVREGGDLAMIAAKIVSGSFTAVCSGGELSAPMMELLRGLLVDDPEQRWGAEEIKGFVNGRAMRSPRPGPDKRALQPFRFRNEPFSNTRLMAMAFGAEPREAARTMREQRIDQWVRKSLLDSELGDRLAPMFAPDSAIGGGNMTDDQVATMACAILDPDGPIRYKGLAFMPDGLGGVLAQGFLTGNRETVQTVAEFVAGDLPRRWLDFQRARGTKIQAVENVFSHLRGYMGDTAPGAGIERCLYALVPGIACRSPHVARDQVHSLSDLMSALDRAVPKTGDSVDLLDRHVAAFICSRSRQAEGQLQAAVSSTGGEGGKRLGLISLLAYVQRNFHSRPLERLAIWAAGRLGPTVATLHNREMRRELQDKLKATAKSGDLTQIVALLNDKVRSADSAAYKQAVKDYAEFSAEAKRIDGGEAERRARARRHGTTASFMIAYAILLMSLVYSYFGILAR